ncbi:MAG TPA: cytochrome c oxidase assembly protein [Gemmatimonadales bacterium]|nr:cytochrome c oxidase assembly protein [Gemmatimonadales bacterium]
MTEAWGHWDVHASVAAGLVLLGGLYVFSGGLGGRRRQVASFAAALVVILVTLNGPLHNLSDHYLFSAHMVQHLLLTMLFPPLLLYGTPGPVARRLLGGRGRAAAVVHTLMAALTRPVVAAATFSGVMAFWHFPAFYEAAMRNHDLHIVQHLTFLASAVLMWWPVLSPLPELPRISYPAQMLYLFLLGIPMSVVGALITLTGRVLYPFYLEAPRLWFDPIVDQQLGGLIMWIPGGLVFWGAMTVVWFRWAAREERGDVEREVPPEAYGMHPAIPRPPSRPGDAV